MTETFNVNVPTPSFASKGRLSLVDAGAALDEEAKTAKAKGDASRGELLAWLAMLHYDMTRGDFVNGPVPGAAYDPVTRFESAPSALFTTIADWAKTATTPQQRAAYATAVFRTERIWKARGLSLGRPHELARAIVDAELDGAGEMFRTGLEAKARGMEFTTAWRRALTLASKFGALEALFARRQELLDVAAALLGDACWWSVGALEVYADIVTDKKLKEKAPAGELSHAEDIRLAAEKRVVETSSFQVADALVETRAQLRIAQGAPRSQQDECAHMGEIRVKHAETHDQHWVRATMFNEASQLFEQAGDKARAEQLKLRSIDEMRSSRKAKEMKTVSASMFVKHVDMDAHIHAVIGDGNDLTELLERFGAHFFVHPLDHPDSPQAETEGCSHSSRRR